MVQFNRRQKNFVITIVIYFIGKPQTESGDCKAIIKLTYVSDWRREPMEGCSSVWPVKRELVSPMKAALVRIVPTVTHKYTALQLQLYGNPVHEGLCMYVWCKNILYSVTKVF